MFVRLTQMFNHKLSRDNFYSCSFFFIPEKKGPILIYRLACLEPYNTYYWYYRYVPCNLNR